MTRAPDAERVRATVVTNENTSAVASMQPRSGVARVPFDLREEEQLLRLQSERGRELLPQAVTVVATEPDADRADKPECAVAHIPSAGPLHDRVPGSEAEHTTSDCIAQRALPHDGRGSRVEAARLPVDDGLVVRGHSGSSKGALEFPRFHAGDVDLCFTLALWSELVGDLRRAAELRELGVRIRYDRCHWRVGLPPLEVFTLLDAGRVGAAAVRAARDPDACITVDKARPLTRRLTTAAVGEAFEFLGPAVPALVVREG